MRYQSYNIIACIESNCEEEISVSPRTNETIIKRYQTKQYKLDKWSNKVENLFFSQQCIHLHLYQQTAQSKCKLDIKRKKNKNIIMNISFRITEIKNPMRFKVDFNHSIERTALFTVCIGLVSLFSSICICVPIHLSLGVLAQIST